MNVARNTDWTAVGLQEEPTTLSAAAFGASREGPIIDHGSEAMSALRQVLHPLKLNQNGRGPNRALLQASQWTDAGLLLAIFARLRMVRSCCAGSPVAGERAGCKGVRAHQPSQRGHVFKGICCSSLVAATGTPVTCLQTRSEAQGVGICCICCTPSRLLLGNRTWIAPYVAHQNDTAAFASLLFPA